MASYLARIGGVMTWVGADDSIDVGIVLQAAGGEAQVEWIGPRTWNELAGDTRMLVTTGQNPGEVLEVWCSDRPGHVVLEDEDGPLSSREAACVIRTLEDSGHRELAARIAPILDRCTKTDPPPAPAAAPERIAAKPA